MTLNTPKITVKKNAESLFNFLTDVKNFEQIMPENTDKFEVTDDGFLFALKGMPTIKLRLGEKTPNSKIVLDSASDKFPFTLIANIEDGDQDNAMVNFDFDGKFNPMITMMVKKPLQKFINALSQNLEELN